MFPILERQEHLNLTVDTWKVSTAAVTSLVLVGPAVVNVSKSNLRVHISVKVSICSYLIWYIGSIALLSHNTLKWSEHA